MTRGSYYYSQSINYFNGVSKKTQLNKIDEYYDQIKKKKEEPK